jgi:hypothetical protein
MPNPLTPLPKDTQHSCVFDYPDRALRPGLPPDSWVPPYPYGPGDDWDPTNPLDNGVPGSNPGPTDRPSSLSVGDLMYIKVTSDNASFGSGKTNVGFQQVVGAGGSFTYNPSSPANTARMGAIIYPNASAPFKNSNRAFVNFAKLRADFGMGLDLTGSIGIPYDQIVSGDSHFLLEFWIFEHVSNIVEDNVNWVWNFTTSGFTKAATATILYHGFPGASPGDAWIYSWFYNSGPQTFTFGYGGF